MSGGRYTKQEPKKVYYVKQGSTGWYQGPFVNPPKGRNDILVYSLKFEGILDTTNKKHIEKAVISRTDIVLPKYVMMGGKGNELRLMQGTVHYYRDAGDWEVGCKVVGDKLFSVNIYGKDHKQLDGNELIPITEAEWRKANAGYLPSNMQIELDNTDPKDLPF